jgi:hypothetical protein
MNRTAERAFQSRSRSIVLKSIKRAQTQVTIIDFLSLLTILRLELKLLSICALLLARLVIFAVLLQSFWL